MTRLRFCIFIASILMIACENERHIIEKKSIDLLDGWEISKTEHGLQINPRDLFFINSQVGFVVGYNGDIYKTVNAGESWQKQNSGTSLHLLSVFFVNDAVGFASGQAAVGCLDYDCDKGSIVLKTKDGGRTWAKTFFENYFSIRSLYFFNEAEGLAFVEIPDLADPYIAKTYDGGDTWKVIGPARRTSHEEFICVDNIVFVAGKEQKVFKSEDFGVRWDTIHTPIPAWNEVRNIYFYNEDIGFLDGTTAIYKTVNGGVTWEEVDFLFPSFGVLHFYSETEGFDIEHVPANDGGHWGGLKGTIAYQTWDSGTTWVKSDLKDLVVPLETIFPQRDLGYGINHSEFYKIKRK